MRKITANLPNSLLEKAMNATGENLTDTLKKGLKMVTAAKAFEEARKLRGKVKFDINLKELRED